MTCNRDDDEVYYSRHNEDADRQLGTSLPIAPAMHSIRRENVGVFVDPIGAFGRGVTRGILAYQRYRRWEISLMRTWVFQPMAFIDRWQGDGLIAMISSPQINDALDRLARPVVCVSSLLPELHPVSVLPDDVAVGAMVARHFIDRGFRNFAFCAHFDSETEPVFIKEREQGFAQTVTEAGFTVKSAKHYDDFSSLLQVIRPPCALFAANDEIGIRIIEIANEMDLRVPEQISVIGVDDDDLLVESKEVSLSSVTLPTFQIGFEAAALLDRMMHNQTPQQTIIRMQPLGIASRKSSDLFAIPDPEVTAALAFIRQHASEPINVGSVVAEVPVSRRVLERRFRQYLQRSILEEILRARIERAQSLLIDTNLLIGDVMHACGFTSRARFYAAFAKATGTTPKDFRRMYRDSGKA